MVIISRRMQHESIEYFRTYEFADMPGAGFSFKCDADGTIERASMNPAARDNLARCLAGEAQVIRKGAAVMVKIHDMGVISEEHAWTEPACGKCSCGEYVDLDSFTNTCQGCGADYNSAGQQLAPRAQWGEDTGESLADIMAIH